ncbi:MAG: tetratricopeptide repeat protein [Rhizomicrobium sp.]|jgi:tetratricopeptide (TPR) repeat protein
MTESNAAVGSRLREEQLSRALAHLNRNEVGQAESILTLLLTLDPSDANALQLMGLAKRLQGDLQAAEKYYRQSLAIDPQQPHVHHNLGNLLKGLGRYDEAIDALTEAVRLKPNYVEAHLNLALALSAKGDHSEAAKCCRAALRIQPNFTLAKQTLAAELNAMEQPKEAEKILTAALILGSRDPRQIAALEHNLGVSLKMQRRYREALALFDAARAKAPGIPAIDYNRGNTLQHLGRLSEAVESYRRAIGINPLDMRAHADLNKLLYRLGADDDFLRSYDQVASLYPDLGMIAMEKANFLFLKGDFAGAREGYERAARLLPDHVTPRDGLALILARSNEFEAAIRLHKTVVEMEPDNAPGWRNYAETLLRAGDAGGARAAAEQALAIRPFDQGTLATWGTALRLLGDPLEERVNDYEKFVRTYELAPPQGYSDMASFNRDLNAYLDRLHSDRRECIDQTLRFGTQTLENLFGAGHGPVELLRARIDEAVADYIAHMDPAADHPLLQRKNAEFEYSDSWSARLHDCGFHTNHVHPKGWISSAYYVALPDVMGDAGGSDGWIKFGEPNFECGLKDAVRRTVQPKVGTLVLFPSYMWHGTVPFRSQQSRTTIAFDVTPQNPKA